MLLRTAQAACFFAHTSQAGALALHEPTNLQIVRFTQLPICSLTRPLITRAHIAHRYNYIRLHTHFMPDEFFDAADELGVLCNPEFAMNYKYPTDWADGRAALALATLGQPVMNP